MKLPVGPNIPLDDTTLHFCDILSEYENIKVNKEFGIVIMKKDDIWRIIDTEWLVCKIYSHHNNYNINIDYANCTISLINKTTGDLIFSVNDGMNEYGGAMTLGYDNITYINTEKFLGLITNVTEFNEINEHCQYIGFSPNWYRTSNYTIYDNELNKIADGSIFKLIIKSVDKFQNIHIFNKRYILKTDLEIKTDGNDIQLGCDVSSSDNSGDNIITYSLFINYLHNCILLSKDFKTQIELTEYHKCSVQPDHDNTYRGLVIPNHETYNSIYEINGTWLGKTADEWTVLDPFKPNSGQITKPAARAAIENT